MPRSRAQSVCKACGSDRHGIPLLNEWPHADEQLAAVSAMLADRSPEVEPGRLALRMALTALANARGLPATRAALRRLAVEALAWERRLPRSMADVRGVDTPHPEKRAA